MSHHYKDLENFIERNKDMFDKHIATVTKLPTGENDLHVKWRNPTTSNGAMEFIYVGGYLTIQGDYGNSSFTWYNSKNTFDDMARFSKSFGYFLSKCSSAERSSIPYSYFREWSDEECVKNVKQWISDYELEVDEYSRWESYTESYWTWVDYCHNHASNDNFGDEAYELIELGLVIDHRAYIHAYALQCCNEFMKEAQNETI